MEWLSDVLTRIQDQPINKIEQILPFPFSAHKFLVFASI
jgi:hypothetical protein